MTELAWFKYSTIASKLCCDSEAGVLQAMILPFEAAKLSLTIGPLSRSKTLFFFLFFSGRMPYLHPWQRTDVSNDPTALTGLS